MVITVLTLQSIIKKKLEYFKYKNHFNIDDLEHAIIFKDIDWHKMDKNIRSFAKYLINFCFYKFGLEVTIKRTND